jgi:hypothetical protein
MKKYQTDTESIWLAFLVSYQEMSVNNQFYFFVDEVAGYF